MEGERRSDRREKMCRQQSERKMQLRHLYTLTLLRKLKVARGKCILTQWVDDMARFVEKAGQTEGTVIDIIHRRTEGK